MMNGCASSTRLRYSNLVLPIIALAEAAFIIERGRTSIPDINSLLDAVQADLRLEIYPLNLEIFQQTLHRSLR